MEWLDGLLLVIWVKGDVSNSYKIFDSVAYGDESRPIDCK